MADKETAIGRRELRDALFTSKRLLVGVGVFSAFVNILMLTGSIFMLQVYDRVLASNSEATLVSLFSLVCALFLFMGLLDHARARILARAGARFQELLDKRVFDAVLRQAVAPGARSRPQSGLRDLETIQRVLSSPAPFALFDMPWAPFFFFIIFTFHWQLGVLALAGGAVLLSLTLLNESSSRKPMSESQRASAQSEAFLNHSGVKARPFRLWACAVRPSANGRNSGSLRWKPISAPRTAPAAMAQPRKPSGFSCNRRCLPLVHGW